MPYTYEYPHAANTADCIVFALDKDILRVLMVERGGEPYKGCWAFPGGFMNMDESIEETALRELKEETAVENVSMEQLYTFSAPGRDPRERVLTTTFYTVVRFSQVQAIAGDDAAKVCWFSIHEIPPMAFDHNDMLNMAVERLYKKLCFEPESCARLNAALSSTEWQKIAAQLSVFSKEDL